MRSKMPMKLQRESLKECILATQEDQFDMQVFSLHYFIFYYVKTNDIYVFSQLMDKTWQSYLKVYGSQIEAQLVCVKTTDHEVYTSYIRSLSQLDSKHYTWTDLDRARIFH